MKTRRIRSGAPFVICGIVVLCYAAVIGFHSVFSYIGAAVLAFLIYAPLRRYFPDRFMVVEVPPDTGNIACDQLILEAREVLKKIHERHQHIPADQIAAKLDRLQSLAQQMLVVLAKQPELQGQLRTFLRYYLPTTLKLTDACVQIAQTGSRGEVAQRTLQRIDEALGAVCQAFEKQLEALDQFRYLNVDTEIDVLRDLLSADGLLDKVMQSQPPEQGE